CDVENWLAREAGRDELKAKLIGMRRSLENDLLVSGEMELVGSTMRVRPLAGRNVLIGRPSSSRQVDIEVNCRWFSRGERSLYLFSEGEDWFIEDLGSANGSFVGDRRLNKNEPLRIPPGETLIEIGRSAEAVAPVTVRLVRLGDAVLVTVQPGGAFKDPELKSWPTLHDDLKKRWLVFREECLLGADESQVLARSPAEAVACLAFRNGFWVSPMSGSEMQIDDLAFQSPVPLPAPAWFKAGPLRLRAERLGDASSRAADVRSAHA
ncbi:MAG: FHA domain-containing protein, partial [Alphaproteobacteria bacterium]|nr:FHA domain-containing protein [Alphaproteobacteria bacterium]